MFAKRNDITGPSGAGSGYDKSAASPVTSGIDTNPLVLLAQRPVDPVEYLDRPRVITRNVRPSVIRLSYCPTSRAFCLLLNLLAVWRDRVVEALSAYPREPSAPRGQPGNNGSELRCAMPCSAIYSRSHRRGHCARGGKAEQTGCRQHRAPVSIRARLHASGIPATTSRSQIRPPEGDRGSKSALRTSLHRHTHNSYAAARDTLSAGIVSMWASNRRSYAYFN